MSNMSLLHEQSSGGPGETAEPAARSPGKATMSERLPVQRKAGASPDAATSAGSHDAGEDPFGLHLEGAPIQAKAGDAGAAAAPAPAETGMSSTGMPMAVQ